MNQLKTPKTSKDTDKKTDFFKPLVDDQRRKSFLHKKSKEKTNQAPYSDSEYEETMGAVLEELTRATEFLSKAMNEPLLLFTRGHVGLGSSDSLLYHAFEWQSRLNGGRCNKLDLQSLLAKKMNDYLQTWLSSRQIQENITIVVRTPNRFPSIYAVMVNEDECMQFDIFEQWYGIRETPETEEEIFLDKKAEEGYLMKNKRAILKQIENLRQKQQHPLRYICSWKDLYLCLFRLSQIQEKIERKLKKENKKLDQIDEEIKQNRDMLPKLIEINQSRAYHLSLLLPFFEGLNYQEQTEINKLY